MAATKKRGTNGSAEEDGNELKRFGDCAGIAGVSLFVNGSDGVNRSARRSK